jgi:hypothetical protein
VTPSQLLIVKTAKPSQLLMVERLKSRKLWMVKGATVTQGQPFLVEACVNTNVQGSTKHWNEKNAEAWYRSSLSVRPVGRPCPGSLLLVIANQRRVVHRFPRTSLRAGGLARTMRQSHHGFRFGRTYSYCSYYCHLCSFKPLRKGDITSLACCVLCAATGCHTYAMSPTTKKGDGPIE